MADTIVTIDGVRYQLIEEDTVEVKVMDQNGSVHNIHKNDRHIEREEMCCFRHGVVESPYRSGECPMCEEEQHVQAMREHEMTRDPTMEPW